MHTGELPSRDIVHGITNDHNIWEAVTKCCPRGANGRGNRSTYCRSQVDEQRIGSLKTLFAPALSGVQVTALWRVLRESAEDWGKEMHARGSLAGRLKYQLNRGFPNSLRLFFSWGVGALHRLPRLDYPGTPSQIRVLGEPGSYLLQDPARLTQSSLVMRCTIFGCIWVTG